MPALPAALSSSAFVEHVEVVAAVGPGHRGADGALVEQLRNAASWITFASWCAVGTSLRSTSVGGTVVTGIPSRTVTSRSPGGGTGHLYVGGGRRRAQREHGMPVTRRRQSPHMNCGIEGGQVGACATRQDRGHPLAREPRLPDRVHALHTRGNRPIAAGFETPYPSPARTSGRSCRR